MNPQTTLATLIALTLSPSTLAAEAPPDTPCMTSWGIDWAQATNAPQGVQVVCHTCISGVVPDPGIDTCAGGEVFTDVVKGRGFLGNNVVYAPTDIQQLRRIIDAGDLSVKWCFDQGTSDERCVTELARDVVWYGADDDLSVCDFYCGSQGFEGGLPPEFTDEILASIPIVGFYPVHTLHREGFHSVDVWFVNDSDETITTTAPDFLPDLAPRSVSSSPGDHTCVQIVKKNG